MKPMELLRLTPALVLGITLSFGIATAAVTDEPLVQQSDLVYQGAFRLPQLGQSADANSYNYGGTSLGYNPANNSLYIVGYDPQQYLGEISIPEIRNSASISSLATATQLQPLRDPTEGKLNSINPSDTNAHKIGGTLVYSNNLYLTGFSYYDGAGTQSTSHFVRPPNLSTTGQVKGPFSCRHRSSFCQRLYDSNSFGMAISFWRAGFNREMLPFDSRAAIERAGCIRL